MVKSLGLSMGSSLKVLTSPKTQILNWTKLFWFRPICRFNYRFIQFNAGLKPFPAQKLNWTEPGYDLTDWTDQSDPIFKSLIDTN